MGFEIWLVAFEHGEQANLSTDDVKACFGPELVIDEFDTWRLDGSEIYVSERPSSTLMIRKPSPRVFECTFKVMQLGNVCLFWPGSHMCVLDESVTEHLPPGLADDYGILIVSNLTDIDNHLMET